MPPPRCTATLQVDFDPDGTTLRVELEVAADLELEEGEEEEEKGSNEEQGRCSGVAGVAGLGRRDICQRHVVGRERLRTQPLSQGGA